MELATVRVTLVAHQELAGGDWGVADTACHSKATPGAEPQTNLSPDLPEVHKRYILDGPAARCRIIRLRMRLPPFWINE